MTNNQYEPQEVKKVFQYMLECFAESIEEEEPEFLDYDDFVEKAINGLPYEFEDCFKEAFSYYEGIRHRKAEIEEGEK